MDGISMLPPEPNKTDAWCEIIKSYIIHKIYNILKSDLRDGELDVMDKTIWNPIFDNAPIKYILLYYSGMTILTIPTTPIVVYPTRSFQEYVDSIANLQRLGAYDYMEFCKNMKIPDFKKSIFNKYEKVERINTVKNNLIYEIVQIIADPVSTSVSTSFQPSYVYEYITQNFMHIPLQKPDYTMFRNKRNLFYEKYTLWEIYHNVCSNEK